MKDLSFDCFAICYFFYKFTAYNEKDYWKEDNCDYFPKIAKRNNELNIEGSEKEDDNYHSKNKWK